MFDTYSKLVDDVWAGLAYTDFLEAVDAFRSVDKSLIYYQVIQAQSPQNQVIAHKDFTPSGRDKPLPDVDGVPVWLERKEGVEPDERYVYVQPVNLASLDEARARGEMRCSFYGEDGTLHVRLSYNPRNLSPTCRSHRLWYDPTPGSDARLADRLPLISSFAPMFAAHARLLYALPMVMGRAAQSKEQVSQLQLDAWKALASADRELVRQWEKRWDWQVFGSPGGQRANNRRPVLSQGGYGRGSIY